MATEIAQRFVTVGGRPTRVLEGGSGETVVFLHGGYPGLSPYCGSADEWLPMLQAAVQRFRVVAVDLAGAGGSEITASDDLRFDAQLGRLVEALEAAQLGRVHIVAHGESGLLALALARDPSRCLSCTLVAATTAAPTGDALEDLTLLHPPRPYWSRDSQLWALERLSYTPHHVSADWVEALLRNADGSAHQAAVAALASADGRRNVLDDWAAAKAAFLAYSRDVGYDVPIDIVWGADDPSTTIARGAALLDLLSPTRARLAFHVVNRSGHFVMRENPAAVFGVLSRTVTRAAEAVA